MSETESGNTMGDRIRRERRRRGMTQFDLAVLTGLSLPTLSLLERAAEKAQDGKGPRYSTVRTVAKALGMTVSELTGD